MKKLFFLTGIFLVTALHGAEAQTPVVPTAQNTTASPPPERRVTYNDALVLGLVEGVTEYLPVSSTGHLIFATHLLGLDSGERLLDSDGVPILTKRDGPSAPLRRLTLNDVVDDYLIIIQGGAILAVLILYWERIVTLVQGMLGRDRAGLLLLRNLILALIPAAVIGLAFSHLIEQHLMAYKPVLGATAIGALIMLGAERWRRRHQPGPEAGPGPDLHELSCEQAMLIGVCQVAALWPGMSRSMVTIVGGYFTGLRPKRAAEFSFLLGLATLTAATGYKLVKHGHEMAAVLNVGPLVFGVVVAAVTAAIAVKWFVGWLTRHGLEAFAWYRLVLAAVVAAMIAAGFFPA